MARKTAKRKNGDFLGYIEYRFDDAEKKAFKGWCADTSAVSNAIEEAAENDYRMTIAYDSFNKAYQCSMSIRDDDHINAGYMLVGRGSDWYSAVAQALYKHEHIMHGDWVKFSKETKNDWD